jgi:hypothetical protein
VFANGSFKVAFDLPSTFGYGHITFTGLLIVGRSTGMDDFQRARLQWRSDKVLIDSNTII